MTYDYTAECTSVLHTFDIFDDGVAVVSLSASGTGSVQVSVGSEVHCTVTVKLASECTSRTGDCDITIDESEDYTGNFTGCPSVDTTLRTLTTGQAITYTATDTGAA